MHLHVIRERHRRNSEARTSAFQHNVVAGLNELRVARVERLHRDLVRRFSVYRWIVLWCPLGPRRARFDFCQRSERVSQADISKYLSADTNIIKSDRDEPRWIKTRSEPSGGFVVKADPSEINHDFGALDDLSRLFRRQHSRIHSGKLRMAFVDDAFFHRRGSKRTTERFDRFPSFPLQSETRQRECR